MKNFGFDYMSLFVGIVVTLDSSLVAVHCFVEVTYYCRISDLVAKVCIVALSCLI